MLCGLTLLLAGCSDRPVGITALPQPIQEFVKQTFPDQAISYVERDLSVTGWEYDIILADGTELNFDADNTWDKIDCKIRPVPQQLVPEGITTHVQQNFGGVAIVKIDKEAYGYEVELDNDLELRFTPQGTLINVDD